MIECAPVRKTTRMARKLRDMCSPAADQKSQPTTSEATQEKRCMRPGPVQRNPYLNFLREYRKNFCGLSAVETVRQGAKAWKDLPKEEKARFILEAFYAPRRRRRLRGRNMLKSVNRHRSSRISRARKSVRSQRRPKMK